MKKLLCLLLLPLLVLSSCSVSAFAGSGSFKTTPAADGNPDKVEVQAATHGVRVGVGDR
ncbi:MAG: hypothetical protein JWO82_2445 [Akkermansiaceae bacterium]|nr:hypothetical protein [Akkermansiaceae bacterium]